MRYGLAISLIAVVYILMGKLGLMLAVPPGYATIIWPPSGISLAILLMYGRRFWPGIFVGSFLLNAEVSGLFSSSFTPAMLIAPLAIAFGSSLQALCGHYLIKRCLGLPLQLHYFRQIAYMLLLAMGACFIAATVGVSTIYAMKMMPAHLLVSNWAAWWLGDALGVLIFLPILLVMPWNPRRLTWRGAKVVSLPAIAIALLLFPLGLTFYGWKITSEMNYRSSLSEFNGLTLENEKALYHRFESYEAALLAAKGFVEASKNITYPEWQRYTTAIDISKNFPGMRGLGWVVPVADKDLDAYSAKVRQSGNPGFKIHHADHAGDHYIITHLAPEAGNEAAIGLDVAFDPVRRAAADEARDGNRTAITRPVVLVQDESKTPGFLVFHPVFHKDMKTDTPQARRAALRGWVYEPLVAEQFLSKLTNNQGQLLNLRVYDGEQETPEALIYSSGESDDAVYTVRRTVKIMEHTWLLVWESTPAYELAEHADYPVLILVGGVFFTFVFGIFLIVLSLQRSDSVELVAGRYRRLLPLLLLVVVMGGTGLLYEAVRQKELNYISMLIAEDAKSIEHLFTARLEDHVLALKRMALRWKNEGGTPETLWRRDAYNLVQQLEGLDMLQWVDTTYRPRWREAINGQVPDLEREQLLSLQYSAQLQDAYYLGSKTPSITMTMYLPLTTASGFQGYLAGLFNFKGLLTAFLPEDVLQHYVIHLRRIDEEPVALGSDSVELSDKDAVWRVIRFRGLEWVLSLTPTQAFIQDQKTNLPVIILISGLLIASFSSLALHYILLARLKSQHLLHLNLLNSAILDHAPYLIVATDKEGYVTSFNKAAEALLGYRAEEIINKETPLLWHDPREVVERALQLGVPPGFEVFSAAQTSERADHREWTYLHKNGTAIPVSLAITTLKDSQGEVLGYLGIAEDITDRRKQQLLMRAALQQIGLLVKNTPAAVAMFDKQFRYLMTSERWLRDYNLKREEIIGRHHYDIFPEIGAMPHWQEIHRRAFAGEVFEEHEESWIRADGKKEWVKWAIHPWEDSEGGIGGIIIFSEVITVRKEAEEALRRSEERFRSAMESASIGMALVSLEGRWMQVNPALCELLGYTSEELLANDFQSITYAEDLETDIVFVRKVLNGEISSYNLEKRYYHKSGRLIWAMLSVSLVRSPSGMPHYFISQIQDISERKEIDRLKSEFISTVSHELRTPLTSIRGALGVILGAMANEVSAKVKELLTVAHNNSERLILLINDILDMDKIASGNMRYDLQDVGVYDITLQAVRDNETYAARYDVQLALAPMPSEWRIQVDSMRFIQILSNLISNASKFSPSSGRVEIYGVRNGGNVRVCVKDHGAGIPAEFHDRIFGKFLQADASSSRARGGTGLGLHITKQMVEHMHGHIGFDTELGKGTCFWVEFPLVSMAG